MPVRDNPTLSEIDLQHGPRPLLARYFSFAHGAALRRGVLLRVRTDFDALLAINAAHAECWAPLAPMFDPHCCDLSGNKAFWIEGVDSQGRTAIVHASRVYDHGKRSVADDLRSLDVFYDDPAPQIAAGACASVSAPAAYYLSGRVAFAGALWVRPDHRRLGFAKFVPRLTRSLALTRWNTPAYWGGVEPALDGIGITNAYGSGHVEDGLTLHLPSWRGDVRFLFLSMGQVTLLRDLAQSLAHSEADKFRKIETPMTNTSPARRQGARTRS